MNTSNMTPNDDNHIRTWESGAYRLELYDTYKRINNAQYRLAYQFYHDGVLIFEGSDYGCSPQHSIDGDESVAALLSFLALKPGDTDREYFDSYTPQQLEWAQQHGEDLGYLAMEMEEAAQAERGEG